VDVARDAAGVGPEADIDLLGAKGLGDRGRDPSQQRPELGRLVLVEIGDVENVALRLDDQRADPERADAMLDHPP